MAIINDLLGPTPITSALSLIGGAGNALGVQGDNPEGLNMIQRMMLTPEQSGALTQQTQAKNTALNSPDLMQTAMYNPFVQKGLSAITPILMRQQQAAADAAAEKADEAENQNPSAATPAVPTASAKSTLAPETIGDTPINNPGNLRPVGATTGFRQFNGDDGLARGTAALSGDLAAKLTGNSPAMGSKPPTLRNIISTFSPPTENNTDALVTQASQRMGVDPDAPLGIQHLEPLTNAILKQEQGGTKAAAATQPPAGYPAGMTWKNGQPAPPSTANQTAPQTQNNNPINAPIAPMKLSHGTQQAFIDARNASTLGGNAEQGRAMVQAAQSRPDYVAEKARVENQSAAQAHMQEEENKNNISYENTINDKANNAVATQRTLAKMNSYLQDMNPGKAAGVEVAIAQYKVATGTATPEETKFAAATEGFDKLSFQLATQAIKTFSNKGTNLDLTSELGSNPNKYMTPQGVKNMIDYMTKTSALDFQKQQEFNTWKQNNNHYPDFDAQWNQKQVADIPNIIKNPTTGGQSNSVSAPAYKTPEDVRMAYKNGKLTKDAATKILQQQHGMP